MARPVLELRTPYEYGVLAVRERRRSRTDVNRTTHEALRFTVDRYLYNRRSGTFKSVQYREIGQSIHHDSYQSVTHPLPSISPLAFCDRLLLEKRNQLDLPIAAQD